MTDPLPTAEQLTTDLGFVGVGDGRWVRRVRGRDLHLRLLTTLAELRPLEELQREVFGTSDLDLFPASGLIVVPETGGMVLAAEVDGALVGALWGFGGYVAQRPRIVSDWMGVRAAARSFGIGFHLKTLQACLARASGFVEIVWTVDPLRAANARLNLEKLGAVANHYEEDRYGAYAAGLYGELPSDRIHMRWDLTDSTVWVRLRDELPPRTSADLVHLPVYDPNASAHDDRAVVHIPSDIDTLLRTAPTAALRWRMELRRSLPAAFAAGYVITGFVPRTAEDGALSAYLLTRSEHP